MKSTRNYVIAVLALILVAGSVLAWRQYQELVGLRAAARADASGDLLKRLADAQKRIQALQDQHAARTARGRSRDETAGIRPEAGPSAGRPDLRNGFRAALNNPAFLKLMAVEQKAGLDGKYAGLFKNLAQNFNLTPEQLDQFKNLLVQKQQSVMDALQAARAEGLSPRNDPDGFSQAVSAAQPARSTSRSSRRWVPDAYSPSTSSTSKRCPSEIRSIPSSRPSATPPRR